MARLHRRNDRGGKWELDYVDVDGRRYRIPTKTADRKMADLWLKKAEEMLSQARLGLIERVGRIDADVVMGKAKKEKSLTVKEFEAKHEDGCRNDLEFSEKTIVTYHLAFNSFTKIVGNRHIDEINRDDVVKWKRGMAKEEKSKATLSIYHRSLRAAFNRAVKWELLERNAFDMVPVAKTDPKEDQTKDMTIEEVQLLLKAIDEAGEKQFGDLVRFLLYTACRRNEIVRLRWQDLDLENWTIKIYAEKTKKHLTIPINKALRRTIENMEIQKEGYIFRSNSNSRAARKAGKPWNVDFVSHHFKKFILALGLPEHYSLHSLRHTYATYLRQKGVALDIVQKLLGHSSPLTTEQNYDHSIALHFRAEADLVDFEQE